MFNQFFNISCPTSFLSRVILSGFLVASVTSCACTDSRKNSTQKNGEIADAALMQKAVEVTQAVATVTSLKGDAALTGKITFTKVPSGIKIVADVNGLTPGKHGFHVHEHGDCGGTQGSAAGDHFNPTKTKHGGPDSSERHVGDLGNLVADDTGHAHYERTDKFIALEGTNSIIGRSIIIHADPDDYTTQPSGNSGAKVGCAIIEAVKNTTTL